MLVLSRKVGEEIVIPGCGITIILTETHGKSARLGIRAPTDMVVFRREIWERLRSGVRPSCPCQGSGPVGTPG